MNEFERKLGRVQDFRLRRNFVSINRVSCTVELYWIWIRKHYLVNGWRLISSIFWMLLQQYFVFLLDFGLSWLFVFTFQHTWYLPFHPVFIIKANIPVIPLSPFHLVPAVRWNASAHKSRIWMCDWDINRYHFWPLMTTLNPLFLIELGCHNLSLKLQPNGGR